MNRPIVDERAAGRFDEIALRIAVPGAQDVDLAACAYDRVLMAFSARLRVINRAESVGDFVAFGECFEIVLKRRLIGEAIGLIVKTRWGFDKSLARGGARKCD
jgi:hypothetical protein